MKKLIGMCAFALWDRRDACLHLARDRIGEKPLFYAWFGDAFVFGSELKCLQAHPSFRADVDRDVLALYLRSSYVPRSHSIYRGVYKLPPATRLSVRPARAPFDPIPYWWAKPVAQEGVEGIWLESKGITPRAGSGRAEHAALNSWTASRMASKSSISVRGKWPR